MSSWSYYKLTKARESIEGKAWYSANQDKERKDKERKDKERIGKDRKGKTRKDKERIGRVRLRCSIVLTVCGPRATTFLGFQETYGIY